VLSVRDPNALDTNRSTTKDKLGSQLSGDGTKYEISTRRKQESKDLEDLKFSEKTFLTPIV
jgi:hypothetical protein